MKTVKIPLGIALLFLFTYTDVAAQCTSGSIQGIQSNYYVNQTYQFNYSEGSGSSFFWSSTVNDAIGGSNTGPSVYVFSATTGQGEICVTRYGEGARPSSECIPINFQPCPLLSTPGNIAGDSVVNACGNYTYSVSSIANATRYLWNGFQGGTKTTTTPEIAITPGDLVSGSNPIQVYAENDCGNTSALSNTFIVTMNLSTQANPSSISGPGQVSYCQNMSYTYTTPAVSGAVEYHWGGMFPGTTIITNIPEVVISDSQTLYSMCCGSLDLSLTLKTKDICGVFSNEITRNVTMLSATPVPNNWPTKVCRSNSRNYYFNVAPILNATSYVWTGSFGTRTTLSPSISINGNDFALGNTNMSVYARLSCNNSQTSAVTRIVQGVNPNIFGICPSGTLTSFTVSPNPSSQEFRVNLEKENPDDEAEITIYNQMNVPVHSRITKESEADFNGLGLQPGIYLIEVRSGSYREVKRMAIGSSK
jgi:hypothetical protein